MNEILIRPADPADAEVLQAVVHDWWGRPIESDMLSRFFLTHFRETCLVAERNDEVVGFLIGFLSQALPDEAYIRLVLVHPLHRGAGIGRALYEQFFAVARRHGRRIIRSVTSPANRASVDFQTRIAFTHVPQEQEDDGQPEGMGTGQRFSVETGLHTRCCLNVTTTDPHS
jgi:GNAT superfamily N-acetyltransferase